MRREMALRESFLGAGRLSSRIKACYDKLILRWFARRLDRIELGSQEWHVLQERLSRGSSVGVDLAKRNLFYNRTLNKCGGELCMFPGAIIYYPGNVSVGFNVFVNRGVFITAPAPISIGDNVLIGPYAVLNSGMHQYARRDVIIRDQGHKCEPIWIGADAWLGAHSVIMPGVTVGTGAVIGAGSIVTRSVDPYTVVAGVPARRIGCRA